MASGFESSGFKRTFTVEKGTDGTTLINYKHRSQERAIPGILLVFFSPLLMFILIFLLSGGKKLTHPEILFLAEPLVVWFCFLPIKRTIVIHQRGLEFLGKKLAFKDIKSTGIMRFGGGTSVYSVNGNVTSDKVEKTYAPYANAFGQDVFLTKRLTDEAQASGILDIVQKAVNGQSIQAQETSSNSNPSTASNNKVIDWVLNNKALTFGLVIVIFLILSIS